MALIKCVECGREISSYAQACPHCGCPANHQIDKQPCAPDAQTRPAVWDDVYNMIVNLNDESGAMKIIRKETDLGLGDIYNITSYIRKNRAFPDNLPKTKGERWQERHPDTQPKPTACKSCRKQISTHTEVCPHCGNQTGVHVCPKCNSTNTETISGASKASSLMLFGVFAANKVVSKYRCRDCNHKF